uniref:Uncharacterized protein n=2 Tax=Culex tarsalis TaxID=7177 RepID=A0A1Q3FRI5_CULTA
MADTAGAPTAGRMTRFALATVGAAKTGAVWAGPAAGRTAFRAAAIKGSLKVAVPVGVERATAVYVGTRASNYVTGGVIPGVLTALAVYDGWCIARWAYNWFRPTEE